MRTAARVDANQLDIVQTLRKCGAKVLHLHTIGKGCPDILVKLPNGKLSLCEIKNGKRKWKLKPDQEDFHSVWGDIVILDSIDAAINWITGETKHEPHP